MSDREKWLEAAVLRLQAGILAALPYIETPHVRATLQNAVADTTPRKPPADDDCFPIPYPAKR